jgi:hypothetical protein
MADTISINTHRERHSEQAQSLSDGIGLSRDARHGSLPVHGIGSMPPPALPSHPSSPHRPTNSAPSSSFTTMTSTKRLSLNFPIQPAEHARQRPQSVILPSPVQFSLPSSPELRPSPTSEANNFLTALAAQERRVLELREELQKAESDLDKLKKQWAVHEAAKKRNELRHVEQLRPLASPTKLGDGEEGERRISLEDERRKAMHARSAKVPQRKVFEGGRHTRTLSLLSPTSLEQRGSRLSPDHGGQGTLDSTTKGPPARSYTAMDSPRSAGLGIALPRNSANSKGTKDDLMNTGKQLVGDLREGLWTFIEDLRQATVGDEAINAARPRHKRNISVGRSPARSDGRMRFQTTPNRASFKPPRNGDLLHSPLSQTRSSKSLLDAETEAVGKRAVSANSIGLDGTTNDKATKTSKAEAIIEDDGWDNWDSPPPKAFSPTLNSSPSHSPRNTSPSPDPSSPRTSMRYILLYLLFIYLHIYTLTTSTALQISYPFRMGRSPALLG